MRAEFIDINKKITPSFIISNMNIEPMEGEVFVDCIGYDGIYSVSNYGRIKSERRPHNFGGYMKEKIKKIQVHPITRQTTTLLYLNNKPKTGIISRLVYESFIGQIEDDLEIMHINKDVTDNRLCNLKKTNRSESNKRNFDLGLIDHSIRKMAKMAIERGAERQKKLCVYDGEEVVRKICPKCAVEKDISEFIDRMNICKRCKSISEGILNPGIYLEKQKLRESGLQKCSKCENILPFNKFYKDKSNRNGITSSCKECHKNHQTKKQR